MSNLIEITMSDDTRSVYTLSIGVVWEDLSDEEKKLLYESEVYLKNKANLRYSKLLQEWDGVTEDLIMLLRKLSPGIVIEYPTCDE